MNKKLAVVLAALMMLSTTTFLAAESPVAGVTSETESVTVAAPTVTDSEVVDAVEAVGAEEEDVVAVVELTLKDGETMPTTVTLTVAGVEDGDAIKALHKYDGVWVERPAKVVDGKVVIDFTGADHFSPVIIVKVDATEGNNIYYWLASPYGAAATLPKTGAVAVLPVAAMACLAGAVACGRKEK